MSASDEPNPPSPGAHPTPRLDARDLVVLRGGRQVLDGASLALSPGELVVVAGPSGSGKSTLLRALAGLVELAAGTLRLDGIDAHSLAPAAYRTRVAYVPQSPVMFDATVADNVAAGPRLRGAEPNASTVGALLARVGLDPALAARRARDLSGGERQRVALARALANEPAVLLLDEPTSALDPASAERVLALVRSLGDEGRAVMVVTHAREHALALGGTRYRCEAGRLARDAHDEGGAWTT